MNEQQKDLKKQAKYYERLGRTIESVFTSTYADRGRMYRLNFFRGVVFGLGTAVGATVVVALIVYALSLFSEIPLVGEITETVKQTLEQTE